KLPEALSHPCEGGGDFMIRGLSRINSAVLLALGAISGTCNRGLAETMESALVKAYQNNPQLNGQRASARATDEAVPQALSGYRPRVSITGTLGEKYEDTTIKSRIDRGPEAGTNVYTRSHATTTPYTGGGTVTQTLFNGFQTANRTRTAESQVSAAR